MSGIECAGLVLAVLPLVIEAVKAYTKGAKTIKDVLLPRHRDEKLEEFYEDLWWEMHTLTKQLRVILDGSPGLTDQRKTELEKGLHSDSSILRYAATTALRDYFNAEDDFLAFGQLIEKIARLLSRLIDNGYTGVRASEMSQNQLLKKLQSFVKSRDEKRTTSTIKERLDLRMKEKDLEVRVANLQKWNGRLGKLIKQTERHRASPPPQYTKVSQQIKRPSMELSLIPQMLYQSLSQCWNCNCDQKHQAQLCLRLPHNLHRSLDPPGIDFELLLSTTNSTMQPVKQWVECSIHVRNEPYSIPDPTSKTRITIQTPLQPVQEGVKLTEICDALNKAHCLGHRLCLLTEHDGIQPEVWRVRSQKRQLPLQDISTTTTLASSLSQIHSLSLPEKRELALMLAYSLVLLDGSPWLQERWTKREVSFFQGPTKDPDYCRPYIFNQMEHQGLPQRTVNLDILHPNLSILSLGIILLEIETGTPIEQSRLPQDLSNGLENDNTDYTVADRLAKALSNCTPDYQEAIFACLDVPWRVAGKQVSLDDPETRKGVYESIISRLEGEVESLGIDLMAT